MSIHRRCGKGLVACLLAWLIDAGIVLSAASLALIVTPAAASAEGLFDLFFGHRPDPGATAYANPVQPLDARPSEPSAETGPTVAYCVRLCDGHFFPIQRTAATAVETCSSFCPASRTKVFSGSSIDHATARDGSRYADLATAYAYRDRIVPGCTCNGKDAFGLARVQVADDPTLRPGDIVATENGFAAYNGNGGRKHGADFTPIDAARGQSEWRRQLAKTPIAPTPVPTSSVESIRHDAGGRQAQLAR
jgi:hypothetical protein